jgi:Outer membrane protein
MKKLATIAKSLLAVVLVSTVVSCSDNDADKNDTAKAPAAKAADGKSLPNIRYIDGDTVSAHYNLAKDFQEASLRAMSRIDAARQSKAKEIQSLASQIEQKGRSNGYLTQESYQADMQKLAKMQQDAELSLANLQRSVEQELAQQQSQLNDSVEAFIKEYNKSKGYDAILFKAAGVYFNPALDITDEVVKGLNARYNKKADK